MNSGFELKMRPHELFAALAEEFVAELPRLPQKARVIVDNKETHLKIPVIAYDGFSIELAVSNSGVELTTDRGFHEYFEIEEDINAFFKQILGLTRDLLSPQVRLRELRSNDQPYRWRLEAWDGSNWVQEFEMGLLIYNFFGRKSQQVFQNHILESYPIDK